MIITGGPGEEESAAIAAVIAHVLAEEAAVVASPRRRLSQSDWIRAWRPRNVTAVDRSSPAGGHPARRIEPRS